jgi:hypothetical protein
LRLATPAVRTTNTTARATDIADVYLSESEMVYRERERENVKENNPSDCQQNVQGKGN